MVQALVDVDHLSRGHSLSSSLTQQSQSDALYDVGGLGVRWSGVLVGNDI
jgi:hypothetical protein